MVKEYIKSYELENGRLREIEVEKKKTLKEIDELLRKDREFLEIMEKL